MGVLKTLAGNEAPCGIRINNYSLSKVTVGAGRGSFLTSRKRFASKGHHNSGGQRREGIALYVQKVGVHPFRPRAGVSEHVKWGLRMSCTLRRSTHAQRQQRCKL